MARMWLVFLHRIQLTQKGSPFHMGKIFSLQTFSFAYARQRLRRSVAKRSCCVMKVKCATMAFVLMRSAVNIWCTQHVSQI